MICIHAQPVDSRNVLIFIKRHHAGAAHDLITDGNLFHIVTGQLDLIIITPVINLFAEIVQHQLLHSPPIAVTEGTIAIGLHKQKTDIIKNVNPRLDEQTAIASEQLELAKAQKAQQDEQTELLKKIADK